jgi:hypothetical protein
LNIKKTFTYNCIVPISKKGRNSKRLSIRVFNATFSYIVPVTFILIIYLYYEVYIQPGATSKNSLKIPKRQSESVYRRRTDNTMAKRKSTKGQTMIYKTYI